jgi:hypothetical protein
LNDDPKAVIQDMITKNYAGMTADPILKEWYNREVFQKLEKSWREESSIKNLDFLYDSFIEVVRQWQTEGKMRCDIAPEMIMASFHALIVIDTHKEEIGIQYFPELLAHISDYVMRGLTETTGYKTGGGR